MFRNPPTFIRTHPGELPDYNELCDILTHEAIRPITQGKEGTPDPDFTTITALLNTYNLSTAFFEANITFEDLKDTSFFNEISSMFNDLTSNILRTQDDPTMQGLFNDLYDYLSETDELTHADLIFVFGSKSTFRVEKAINLYNEGLAPKILISGKSPFYEREKVQVSEAETLAQYARDQGIPASALILENNSITVPDNVKRSLNLLEKESISHQSIILVNAPFSQRRGWAHFNKMSKKGTRLIRSNTDKVSEQFSRNGWYRSQAGVRVIIKEFFGLRVSRLMGTA